MTREPTQMEPTQMQLRVAQAMYERATVQKPWKSLPLSTMVKYLNDAAAAIQSMREPTTEMMSGYNSFTKRENWKTMIDAASQFRRRRTRHDPRTD